MNPLIFSDREHAGELLAHALRSHTDHPDVIVLGMPRGGVPVAWQVAKHLHAPLDLIVVRKLGVPGWEELAMGAIASGGVRVIHEDVIRESRIRPEVIERVAAKELEELHRRETTYRGRSGAPEVRGKTVILVDDGIATGSTIRAAVQALRQMHPARIIVAAPVGAPESCALLAPLVDELVVLSRPAWFHAVGQWYENFQQTTDAEVRHLMELAGAAQGTAP